MLRSSQSTRAASCDVGITSLLQPHKLQSYIDRVTAEKELASQVYSYRYSSSPSVIIAIAYISYTVGGTLVGWVAILLVGAPDCADVVYV